MALQSGHEGPKPIRSIPSPRHLNARRCWTASARRFGAARELVFGEYGRGCSGFTGQAYGAAMDDGTGFQEQLETFERKMEKHRTDIREQAREAQRQVEEAEQRQRDSGESNVPLGDHSE